MRYFCKLRKLEEITKAAALEHFIFIFVYIYIYLYVFYVTDTKIPSTTRIFEH